VGSDKTLVRAEDGTIWRLEMRNGHPVAQSDADAKKYVRFSDAMECPDGAIVWYGSAVVISEPAEVAKCRQFLDPDHD
jgi:hypothetical protein